MMSGRQYIDLVSTWETNNRVTEYLFENVPDALWSKTIPGMPRRTIRMVAGHIHNARCMWIKMVGRRYGVKAPKSVDRRRITRRGLLNALRRSNVSIGRLLRAGLEHGGRLPMEIPWSNIPPDVWHFAAYMVAHEAHHRGQIVQAARQLGIRLPPATTAGMWQWKMRNKEARRKRTGGKQFHVSHVAGADRC